MECSVLNMAVATSILDFREGSKPRGQKWEREVMGEGVEEGGGRKGEGEHGEGRRRRERRGRERTNCYVRVQHLLFCCVPSATRALCT